MTFYVSEKSVGNIYNFIRGFFLYVFVQYIATADLSFYYFNGAVLGAHIFGIILILYYIVIMNEVKSNI